MMFGLDFAVCGSGVMTIDDDESGFGVSMGFKGAGISRLAATCYALCVTRPPRGVLDDK